MKTIEITITAAGITTVQTKGFSGESCRDASRLIEEALGEKISEQLTSEFYQSQATEQLKTQQ